MPIKEVAAQIRTAIAPEDLQAVQRFKYDVYVEEMGRYGDIADHTSRLLIEPDDPASHVFNISVDSELAGTMRLTWGGDNALHDRQIEQYDLAPFLEHLPPEHLVVGERFMIAPQFRGTNLLFQMFTKYLEFVNERRIQLIFGDCEPHLLNTYQALGFRTYTDRNVNSPETGYLIPLVLVAEDVDYLRRIGSPLAEVATEFSEEAMVPDNIDALLAGGEAVQSERMLTAEAYLQAIKSAASEANALNTGLFSGMTEEEILICVGKSVMIDCNLGDRVIKKGNVAKNLCMALSGGFEVRNGAQVIARIGAGEVFGEIAFFLKEPRTMDVVAVDDDTRMISFNDRTLRSMMQSHPEITAKLLYNISTVLCRRLNDTNKRI